MKRYSDLKIKKTTGRGSVYRISLTDKFSSDVSILTTYIPRANERFDNIAYKFYGDSNLWYVIARANKSVNGSLYPTPNKVLLIPRIN